MKRFAVVGIPIDMFPFKVTLFRTDTREELWSAVAAEPGQLDVPGFGGQGFRVAARIEYPDGTVMEEE